MSNALPTQRLARGTCRNPACSHARGRVDAAGKHSHGTLAAIQPAPRTSPRRPPRRPHPPALRIRTVRASSSTRYLCRRAHMHAHVVHAHVRIQVLCTDRPAATNHGRPASASLASPSLSKVRSTARTQHVPRPPPSSDRTRRSLRLASESTLTLIPVGGSASTEAAPVTRVPARPLSGSPGPGA